MPFKQLPEVERPSFAVGNEHVLQVAERPDELEEAWTASVRRVVFEPSHALILVAVLVHHLAHDRVSAEVFAHEKQVVGRARSFGIPEPKWQHVFAAHFLQSFFHFLDDERLALVRRHVLHSKFGPQ